MLDEAMQQVIALDEPHDQNFVRKHYLEDLKQLEEDDSLSVEEAKEKTARRIFGAAPSSYGAGILRLINEKNWRADTDCAETYINREGYAYTKITWELMPVRNFVNDFRAYSALHNQDNREHDIFDSDDYSNFMEE